MKINLWTNYYEDANPDRAQELYYCLRKNLDSKLFDHVFYNDHERKTYNEIFQFTRQFPKDINIISNADIYFDGSIKLIQDMQWSNNLCLALSRWDIEKSGAIKHFNCPDSQDVWIFSGAVPKIVGADFYVGGIAGCDNKIAHLLAENGYQIYNPSKDIRCVHYHLSGIRNYINGDHVQRLPPPYKLVAPCNLTDLKMNVSKSYDRS